jgi:hypothetical protein
MVRGTTMANKTRSRSKGGGSGCSDSPLIDLTSYGFSRGSGKKRAASAAAPPPTAATATPADGGDVPDDDDDDDDDGSPPKRARPEEDGGGTITSAGDDDGGGGGGGGGVCDPSSSSSPPPSLEGMADACVDAILLAGVVGGRQQRLRRKEQRGDDVRVGGLGESVGVGVGVGDDDVAGRGTRRGGGGCAGSSPPPPGPAGGGSSVRSHPPAARSDASTSTTTTPGDRVRTLALVRVGDPHQIACSTAVARWRGGPPPPTAARVGDPGPRPVFPGAVLGRMSSNGRRPEFVDLGIPVSAAGISRRHLEVLSVWAGPPAGDGGGVAGVDRARGTTTPRGAPAVSSSASSSAPLPSSAPPPSSSTRHHPSMLVRVHEKSTNGAKFHRTRRGVRTSTYVPQGGRISLRIGDAIEFYSNDGFSYCVVGLALFYSHVGFSYCVVGSALRPRGGDGGGDDGASVAGMIGDDDVGVGTEEASGGGNGPDVVVVVVGGGGGGGGPPSSDAVVPSSRGTSATRRNDELGADHGGALHSAAASAASTAVARDRTRESREATYVVKSTGASVPEAVGSGPVSAVACDRLECMELSQETISLAKMIGGGVPDVVYSSSGSTTAAASSLTVEANQSTGMKVDDHSSVANYQTNEDAAPMEQGDYVKVLYEVPDMFGDIRKEW